MKFSIALKFSDVVFIKLPTIAGILTFMSIIDFMLSSAEHEKSFITQRPCCFAYGVLAFVYQLLVYMC